MNPSLERIKELAKKINDLMKDDYTPKIGIMVLAAEIHGIVTALIQQEEGK